MPRALIVVDVQKDFIEGGSLAVTGGKIAATRISKFIKKKRFLYDAIVLTRDWHIHPGEHFAAYTGEEPNYTTTWPDHCVANTPGAEFADELVYPQEAVVFSKGMYSAAYSGFDGSFYDAPTGTDILLQNYLQECGIDTLDVCGIATDYCVKATVIDGLVNGFNVKVFRNLIAAVDNQTGANALVDMTNAGAQVTYSML